MSKKYHATTTSNMAIPHSLTLPFGYRIRVCVTNNKDLLDKEDNGAWNVDTRTIYIRATLSPRRQRYIMAHELGHAFLDWQHEIIG